MVSATNSANQGVGFNLFNAQEVNQYRSLFRIPLFGFVVRGVATLGGNAVPVAGRTPNEMAPR